MCPDDSAEDDGEDVSADGDMDLARMVAYFVVVVTTGDDCLFTLDEVRNDENFLWSRRWKSSFDNLSISTPDTSPSRFLQGIGRVVHVNRKSTNRQWRPPIIKFNLLESVLHDF